MEYRILYQWLYHQFWDRISPDSNIILRDIHHQRKALGKPVTLNDKISFYIVEFLAQRDDIVAVADALPIKRRKSLRHLSGAVSPLRIRKAADGIQCVV